MDNEGFICKKARTLKAIIPVAGFSSVSEWLRKFEHQERKRIVNYNTDGLTALCRACELANIPVINLLIDECGADVETKCSYAVTKPFDNSVHVVPPIWVASFMGHEHVVGTLLEHGASVNGCSDTNSTAIRAACLANKLEMVKYLISQGADVNIPDIQGSTCLMKAVGNAEIVKLLVENGARVNEKENGDSELTALRYAVLEKNIESTKVLVEAGADINVADKDGFTPLFDAALFYHVDIVNYLLSKAPQVNENKIMAYELLGCYALTSDDIDTAAEYWTEVYTLKDAHKDQISERERKFQTRSIDFGPEPQTLSEFLEMPKSYDSMFPMAVSIKEKYFGPFHEDYLYTLLAQAEKKYNENQNMDALKIYRFVHRQFSQSDKWHCENNFYALKSYIFVFEEMLEQNEVKEDISHAILDIIGLFSSIVNLVKMTLEYHERENEKHIQFVLAKSDHLLCITLYVIRIVVSLKKHVDRSNYNEFLSVVQDLVKMNPRFRNNDTLLHALVDKRTFRNVDGRWDTGYSPIKNKVTIATMHDAGLCLDTKGYNGMTVLHRYLSSYKEPDDCGDNDDSEDDFEECDDDDDDNERDIEEFIRFLLELGAHIDALDSSGKSSLEELRRDFCGINVMEYRNLQCLSALCVVKNGIPYQNCVPKCLASFVELHS